MKIATRAAYGKALMELGEQYPDLVVLDADLSGSTMTKDFAAKYPHRFFDIQDRCRRGGTLKGGLRPWQERTW